MLSHVLEHTASNVIIDDLPTTPVLNENIKETLSEWINNGFSDDVPLHVRGMLIACYETCCNSSRL